MLYLTIPCPIIPPYGSADDYLTLPIPAQLSRVSDSPYLKITNPIGALKARFRMADRPRYWLGVKQVYNLIYILLYRTWLGHGRKKGFF